jgi:hypothetical protein
VRDKLQSGGFSSQKKEERIPLGPLSPGGVGVRGKISNISGQDLSGNSLGKVRMSIKVKAPTVKEIVVL